MKTQTQNFRDAYKVGDRIKTELTLYPGVIVEYEVVTTNIEGDGRGQTQLSTTRMKFPGQKTKKYELGERTIVVDDLWFHTDSSYTHRRITHLKN